MLLLGTLAQALGGMVSNGAAFLIPAVRARWDLDLAHAGLVVSMTTAGLLVSLIAWGALADAIGERWTLSLGTALTAGALVWAAAADTPTALGLALAAVGIGSASVNAASGRVVVGWFPPERRGLAMGIRQSAQPIGTGIAAVVLPTIGAASGIGSALMVPAVVSAVLCVVLALWLRDPPRPSATARPVESLNPYRSGGTLVRIHVVSVLLVLPQFVIWSWTLVYLVDERHFTPAAAGVVVLISQLLAGAARLLVGICSDRLGSRMRPLRWVAIGASVVTAGVGITAGLGTAVVVPLLVIAAVLTAADNGLAFTAVAEIGGRAWAGRALGVQNTAQFAAGTAVVPIAGAAIAAVGFGWTFGLVALAAAVAVPLVPDDPGQPRGSAPEPSPATDAVSNCSPTTSTRQDNRKRR